MALRDELLEPIPGPTPGGADLRYDPVYDKIKEARREDDDAPQGDWQTARKTADWPVVIKLSKDVIAKRSKDLQVAAWLTEAMLRRDGFAGLRQGVDLLDGLIEKYWDHLHPAVDEGDLEMRAAPLDWLGSRLDLVVRMTPLTRTGLNGLQYLESRMIPTEVDAAADEQKATARTRAIEDGKLSPEDFDQAFTSTPKVWYKSLFADVEECLKSLQALDDRSQEKFGNDGPSYGKLRGALEEAQRNARQLLNRKLELEPDAPEAGAAADSESAASGAAAPTAAAGGGAGVGRQFAGEATSRDDASARIVSAARFLRKSDPYSPASYLLLRGFRWGELRAGGQNIDPRLLEAPATQVRTQLKTLMLDAKWRELVDACETVMGTPQGRGWIDLQRYVLTACDELEGDYHFVAAAIRAELRTLLNDLPQLVDMTLMDDTPTANSQTRAWLRDTLLPQGLADAPEAAAANGDGGQPEEARPRDTRALALAEFRAGRADRAITLLMREASREKTRRGRFLHQTQLAGIMVESGHEAVALPILEELIAHIEAHKLEEWEAGDVVAQPMALLYRCLDKVEGDATAKQSLYLRICRLDPLQAIGFAQPQPTSP